MRIIKPTRNSRGIPDEGPENSKPRTDVTEIATARDIVDGELGLDQSPTQRISNNTPGGKRKSALNTNHDVPHEKKEFNRLLASGIRMLAMREHSVQEVTDKLKAKSDSFDQVVTVVQELLEKKYLSDERFAESYVRARSNRGFGPVKIRSELKNKGVSDQLIEEYLDINSPIWLDRARDQHNKKYGSSPVSDYNAWSKRARFMQSRGFTMEHIRVSLPEIEFT